MIDIGLYSLANSLSVLIHMGVTHTKRNWTGITEDFMDMSVISITASIMKFPSLFFKQCRGKPSGPGPDCSDRYIVVTDIYSLSIFLYHTFLSCMSINAPGSSSD